MFSSTVLDVAIGLMFVFFAVSLAASAVLEAIGGMITWRSGTLLKGIKDLLNDQHFTGLAAQLYQHALVNPRNSGAGTSEAALRKDAPAYIDPKQFADALIDILNTGKPDISAAAAAGPGHPGKMATGNLGSIANAVDYVVPAAGNPQINTLLHGIARRTGGDLGLMRQELASWFDNAMDRLSGYYKRWTLLWNFLIALVLAIVLNLSAIHVSKVLWSQPSSAKVLESAGKEPSLEQALSKLQQVGPLPMWWSHYNEDVKNLDDGRFAVYWLELVLGWLITAAATLFGAPFWFDLLQRIVRLKSSGPSPKEKQEGTAAAG